MIAALNTPAVDLFKRSPKAAVLSVIEALEELGMVRREGEAYRLQG